MSKYYYLITIKGHNLIKQREVTLFESIVKANERYADLLDQYGAKVIIDGIVYREAENESGVRILFDKLRVF